MKHRLPILLGSAFILVLCAALDAHAAFIPWSYNWSPGSAFVSATTGTGRIDTSNEPLGHAVGTTDVVITNLKTESSSPRSNPDVYSNAPFSASMTIVDGLNGLHATVSFAGVFNGKISSGSSDVEFRLTSPRTETVVLGNDMYTITFNRYSPPGPPSAVNTGSMSAHVKVTSAAAASAPEPSSALLACLGATFLGLASWRRWRKGCPAGTLCGIA
jgi:hypothetical protein